MSFPTALPSSEITTLTTMQFATDCYLLVWGNEVIFKARVNQATFTDAFATVTFDTVTVGAYTAAIEGYTIHLSTTDDIRKAYWWGRLRIDATATVLGVEYTSIQPTNNDYIFVTKDVRPGMKTPWINSSDVVLMDYAITYRAPPPTISGMPTDELGIIDSDGNADIPFTPGANAIANGATISSWAWSADGGSFQAGNASSQNVTLRYTIPGWYMPRVTVTDSNGITSWFASHVYIAPNDLSSVISLRYQDIQISGDLSTGWNTAVPFWDGVQNVLDHTQCAIYAPHKTSGNKMIFSGRIRTETTDYSAGGTGTATFNIEGIAQQMNTLTAISWRYVYEASPTLFNHITNLTEWRFVGNYIRELTNLNNTHSLSFDSTAATFIYKSYFMSEGTLLDSLRDQLWSVNNDLEFSSDGMIKLVRSARYQTAAERNALTTVADLDFDNLKASTVQDIIYSLDLDHSFQVGKAITGLGWFITASDDVNVLKGTTPAVIPGRGNEQSSTDRQIMTVNATRDASETEGKRRTKNDFAAKQNLETITASFPGGFLGKFNPSVSQWYTLTITVLEGIRLIAYTSSDRWLLTDISISYSLELGAIGIDCTFQIESDDLGYSILIQDPPAKVGYNVPVLPPMSAYPSLPISGDLTLPTGATDGDDQPVKKKDKDPVEGAKDPGIVEPTQGDVALVWTESEVFVTRDLNATTPTWQNHTPSGLSGTIKECVWNPDAPSREGAYCVTNNGNTSSPETIVYQNPALGQIQTWQSTALDDMLATQIRAIGETNVAIYGKFKQFIAASWTINQLDGNGTEFLRASSQEATHTAPVRNAAGVYNESGDYYAAQQVAADEGQCANIEFDMPPGTTITYIRTVKEHFRSGSADSGGESINTIEIDGVIKQQTGLSPPNGGPFTTINTYPGLSYTGETMLFHMSYVRPTSNSFTRWKSIEIRGSSEEDHIGFKFSNDSGETFPSSGDAGLMTLGDGSFDVRYRVKAIMAADDQTQYGSSLDPPIVVQADQGASPGQYAKAVWLFARNTVQPQDYLYATDAGKLFKVINDVETDITPNDGVADGIVVDYGSLAMTDVDNDYIWALMTFSGSMKLAYTTAFGSAWSFNTDPTSNATWVERNRRSLAGVYITDGGNILVSNDGGNTFKTKTGPASDLKGIAIL